MAGATRRGAIGWGPTRWALVLTLTVAFACRAPDAVPPTCPEGQGLYGDQCATRLDDCGPVATPVRGGGCLRAGVVACAEGFADDGVGGCRPILAAACGKGALAVPGEAACVPVGPVCGADFAAATGGGCSPVLPKSPCPAGTLGRPGDAACVAPACPTEAYGDPPSDAPVLYVDQAYGGGGSDGSKSRPFLTIAAALAAASSTGATTVAVAAGSYAGPLLVDKPVRLFGRCPSLVHVTSDAPTPTVRVRSAARLHGLSITGPGPGIEVVDAAAEVDVVRVHDTGGAGVVVSRALAETSLAGKDLLVEAATGTGVDVLGATLTLAASAVRDTAPKADGSGGFGVAARPAAGSRPAVSLVSTTVQGNLDAGILLVGALSSLRSVAVRDTAGAGIMALIDEGTGVATTLTLDGVTVQRSADRGVRVVGSKLTAKDLTVSDVKPRADGRFGQGVYATATTVAGKVVRADVSVVGGHVEAATGHGVVAFGSTLHLEKAVVRGTRARADGTGGVGVALVWDPTARVRADGDLARVVVEDNLEAGLYVTSASVRVEASSVRGTRARKVDATLGDGISVHADAAAPTELAAVTVVRSVVEDNTSTGVDVLGSTLTLEESVVRATRPTASARLGFGVFAAADGDRPTHLVMRKSHVADDTTVGVVLLGSDGEIEDSVVSGTRPQPFDGRFGFGILVAWDSDARRAATLTLRRSLLEANVGVGLFVWGGTADVGSVVVRDTAPGLGSSAGVAALDDVADVPPAKLTVTASVLRANAGAGLLLGGGTAAVEGSVVAETRPDVDGLFGDGVHVRKGASASTAKLTDSVVLASARAGVSVFGGSAQLGTFHLSCNPFSLAVEPLAGSDPDLHDEGGVLCGCGSEVVACRARSSGLTPMPLPTPPLLR